MNKPLVAIALGGVAAAGLYSLTRPKSYSSSGAITIDGPIPTIVSPSSRGWKAHYALQDAWNRLIWYYKPNRLFESHWDTDRGGREEMCDEVASLGLVNWLVEKVYNKVPPEAWTRETKALVAKPGKTAPALARQLYRNLATLSLDGVMSDEHRVFAAAEMGGIIRSVANPRLVSPEYRESILEEMDKLGSLDSRARMWVILDQLINSLGGDDVMGGSIEGISALRDDIASGVDLPRSSNGEVSEEYLDKVDYSWWRYAEHKRRVRLIFSREAFAYPNQSLWSCVEDGLTKETGPQALAIYVSELVASLFHLCARSLPDENNAAFARCPRRA